MIKQDRQLVTVGGTQLTFYLAPGHTSDGIFTIVEPLGICEQSLQYIASLRESIVSSDEAALDAFINDSPFPIGMRKFHEDNKALVKKELQSKNS